MEEIWMVILFLAPGLMFHAIDRKIFMRDIGKHETYDYMFNIVAHSLLISSICLLLMKFLIYMFDIECQMKTLLDIGNMMNSLPFIAVYAVTAVLVTITYWYYYHRLIKPAFQKVFAHLTKDQTGNAYTGYENVYDGIFSNKEYTEHLMPVTILQNGVEITSGTLSSYNTSDQHKREFKIEYQAEIQEILTQDEKASDDEKVLRVDFEYFDLESGTLFRFYGPEKLEKYWAAKY